MLTPAEEDDVKLQLIRQVDAFSVHWLENSRGTFAIVETMDYERLGFRVIEDDGSITLQECDDWGW